MAAVPAKTVVVLKYNRAECAVCTWVGLFWSSYAEANAERMAHLESHRT